MCLLCLALCFMDWLLFLFHVHFSSLWIFRLLLWVRLLFCSALGFMGEIVYLIYLYYYSLQSYYYCFLLFSSLDYCHIFILFIISRLMLLFQVCFQVYGSLDYFHVFIIRLSLLAPNLLLLSHIYFSSLWIFTLLSCVYYV